MVADLSDVEQAAAARYAEQAAVAAAAGRVASAAWAEVDLDDVGGSWLTLLLRRVLPQVAVAQLAAARGARRYLDRVRGAYERLGVRVPAPVGRLEPRRLVGVAADGRDLTGLLYQPAITTLRGIGQGAPPRRAAVAGAVQLDMIVRTEVADTGRVATGVEITATPTLGYVRLVEPPACARCIILAGRWYPHNAGFARHPRCDCIHIPAAEDAAGDLRTDPRQYIASLDEAERRRVLGQAGAQAWEDGSDLGRVVNARRGMYTAGGRLFTREGTRRRGARRVRLMPEQIYREAAGSREEAVRLLRLHGYIT